MIRVTRKKQNFGKRSDERALKTIEAAGWKLTGVREGGVGRFVATRDVREEDDSTTRLFESTYTLEGLAKQVDRRMREEGL